MNLPEELVKQFRTVALERLDRVEAAWSQLLTVVDADAATVVHRELHTLKGESKMLGYADVNLVCHKLEDLLEVAAVRGYAIDEDFDLIVNMALRFMAMLVRKKVGAKLSGIDLPGFIKQIDSLLAELRPDDKRRTTTGTMHPLRAATATPRVPAALRNRLEPIAIDAFVEYAVARRSRRDRLRASWHALRELVGMQRAVIGPSQLAKHRDGAIELAHELGKRVDIAFEIDTVEATAAILAAVDSLVLHLLRNAIDHGLEPPDERAGRGKPEIGTLRVHCHVVGSELVVRISDDGRGVQLAAVRARAIELGVLDPRIDDISERWVELVCAPGFTTRRAASDVSGRGVGLDSVRASVLELGGTLRADSTEDRGTTWHVAIPLPRMTFDAHLLRPPGLSFPVALDASWQPTTEARPGTRVFELAYHLGITDERVHAQPRFFARDGDAIGLVVDREPVAASVRRVINPVPPAAFGVILVDATEGLLVHPDRLI